MSAVKPLRLKPKKFIYVACVPVSFIANQPPDQSPCTIQDCPHCKAKMWVSEKKRAFQKYNPKKVKIYCGECIAKAAQKQGYEIELFDLGQE